MSDTFDLQEMADALGLKSKHAARKRVHAIKDSLEKRGYIVYDPEHGNALNVTLEGVNLLQRMNDMPGSIAEKAAAIMIELGDNEPPPDAEELRVFKQDVKEWQARHRDTHKEQAARIDQLEAETQKIVREHELQMHEIIDHINAIDKSVEGIAKRSLWARLFGSRTIEAPKDT